MTAWEATTTKLSTNFVRVKPLAIALAIGLVGGPFISHLAGWQVTSSSAKAQVRAGVVEHQAQICETRARAEVALPGELDWSAQRALAQKWAVMPGATEADWEVISACTSRFGK